MEQCCRERDLYKHEYEKEGVINGDLIRSKEVCLVPIEWLTEEKCIWTESQGRWTKRELDTLTEQVCIYIYYAYDILLRVIFQDFNMGIG